MKLVLKVQHTDGGEIWDEDYDNPSIKNLEDAQKWSFALIQKFNDTLRLGEKPRKIVSVSLAGESESQPHDWRKMNLVTVMDHLLGFYDILQCRVCGITAKRFGLDCILIDRKFRAKKYQKCNVERPRTEVPLTET